MTQLFGVFETLDEIRSEFYSVEVGEPFVAATTSTGKVGIVAYRREENKFSWGLGRAWDVDKIDNTWMALLEEIRYHRVRPTVDLMEGYTWE